MSSLFDQAIPEEEVASSGIFAIRGSLDGDNQQEFVEREQFIGLKIGAEVFYLSIASVAEIIMPPSITYVPRADKYIEGVINLRGTIIPTINLRKMMGHPKGLETSSTRIVISNFNNMTFGLIVDAITYVVALLPSSIEEQGLPVKAGGADIITRISKDKNEVIGILDLGKIVLNLETAANLEEEKAD